jgi:hypothetical protein
MANIKLTALIGAGYNSEPGIFYLKFNGHQFVKEN